MTAPDAQPPAVWWSQDRNTFLVQDECNAPLFVDGVERLPVDAVRLVPEHEMRRTWTVDMAADMADPRWVICPEKLHPSFLIDSADSVACPWCPASAALAGTTTPTDAEALADELFDLARRVESEAEIAARPGQLDRLDAIANRLRSLGGLQREVASTPTRTEETDR